jgi:hypothetical protein
LKGDRKWIPENGEADNTGMDRFRTCLLPEIMVILFGKILTLVVERGGGSFGASFI